MALKTQTDLFTEVLVRANRTTTDGFITDAMLKSWFFTAHNWAASSYKWPFTEGRVQTTFAQAGGPGADEWYFEGFKADSFRMIQVGGKRLLKLNFEDYQILREEEPQANDRVFTDLGRYVLINPNADVSGTVVAYGQMQPYVDITDENGPTVFTNYEDEGNDAIVEKMLSYYFLRESKTTQVQGKGIISPAIAHEQTAQNILDRLWKRILDEQYAYQSHPDRGGMWTRFDVLKGRSQEEMWRRDQF